MFTNWVEMAVSAGVGVLISSLKKVKIFHFSCMLVIYLTLSWLLKYVVLLLMVKIMLKAIKKFCGFAYEVL